MRILIADTCRISRMGIRSIACLSQECEISEAESLNDLYARVDEGVDLMTFDPALSRCTTPRVVEEIFRRSPAIRVLIISDENVARYGLARYRHDAISFLTKGCTKKELTDAIHSATVGKPYFTDAAIERLVFDCRRNVASCHQILTSRELDVFALLVHGSKVGEIGKILSLSPKTISTHKVNIMSKLHTKKITSLYEYAIDQKLTEECSLRSNQLLSKYHIYQSSPFCNLKRAYSEHDRP